MEWKKEEWDVVEKDIIYPEDLERDSDKYGGCGVIMKYAIAYNIHTIPICNNCSSISLSIKDIEAFKRILRDKKVDIYSYGYFLTLNSNKVKVYFHGTKEEIPLIHYY